MPNFDLICSHMDVGAWCMVQSLLLNIFIEISLMIDVLEDCLSA